MSEKEYIRIEELTTDGGVIKKVIKEGTGECPKKGYKVKAHYTGTLEDGKKFDSSRDRNEPFEFELGRGHVIKGWDIGFASMKVGEHADLVIKSEYGYGASGAGANIPPNATLIFDVELLSFEENIVIDDMTYLQRIEAATKLKEQGNEFFNKKNYMNACSCYEKGIPYLHFAFPFTHEKDIIVSDEKEEEEMSKGRELAFVLHNNKAMACIKMGDYHTAIVECTEVLSKQPQNVKALYRRGLAKSKFGLWQEAVEDLKACLELDPENKSAKNELASLNQRMTAKDEKQKKSLRAFFQNGFGDECYVCYNKYITYSIERWYQNISRFLLVLQLISNNETGLNTTLQTHQTIQDGIH